MTTRAALLGGGSRPARRGRSAPGWRRIGSRLGGEHHKIEWSAPLDAGLAAPRTLESTGEHLQAVDSKGFAGSCYVFTQVYISDIIGHNRGLGATPNSRRQSARWPWVRRPIPSPRA